MKNRSEEKKWSWLKKIPPALRPLQVRRVELNAAIEQSSGEEKKRLEKEYKTLIDEIEAAWKKNGAFARAGKSQKQKRREELTRK